MIDMPAGWLATDTLNTPTWIRPTAAANPRPGTPASQAAPVPSGSDAPPAEGDRVTILNPDGPPRGEQPAGLDTSSLYNMFEGIRDSARPATGGRSAPTVAGISMQDVLDSFGQQQVSNRVKSLGDRLSEWLEQLRSYDPEQAQRLAVLMDLLAKIHPDGYEKILGQVVNALDAFSGIFQGGSTLGEIASTAGADAAAQAQAAATAQNATEIVHFSLDIEVSSSSETTSILAQMRDEGIDVQATRVSESSTMRIHIEFTGIRQQVQQSDPLVLDLNGDGVNLTDAENGALFDIDADGQTDRTAFVQGDDALLALDRNGNGRIDDGSELFGDQNGAANGFAELARYDDNADGVIDAKDKIYESLRLLRDVDGDGIVQAYELSKLSDMGVLSLDLGYADTPKQDDGKGNSIAQRSAFTRADGTRGGLVDVWLGYRT